MIPEIDEPYRTAFDELLRGEGNCELEQFMEVNIYDEVPLFSRFTQLAFLDHLPFVERNRLMIQVAVIHLGAIVEYAGRHYQNRSDPCLRLVSVNGWGEYGESGWCPVDGTDGLLTPCFFVGNLTVPELTAFAVRSPITATPDAAAIALRAPTSAASEFVFDALARDSGVCLYEAWDTRWPEPSLESVYVELI